MSELKHSLTITMKDNVAAAAGKAKNAMDRFARSGSASMKMMAKTLPMVSRGLDKIGNKYTALLSGGAAYAAIKSTAALETRLTRLGVQAGKSDEEIKALNDSIYAVAQDRQINVDPSQLLAAVEQIVEKTGDLDLARGNLENIGAMMSATGAAGADAGTLIADMFEKFNIKTPEEMLKTLDLLTNQGKSGAFTLQYLATQGERVTSAYARLGRTGAQGAAEMGAMLQMIKKGVGSPEQAATALEAYVRSLKDANKQKELMKAGIKLMDPNDPKRMRSGAEIMKDIIKAVDGNDTQISKIFDGEAMRAFVGVVNEFNKSGEFSSLDSFLTVANDGKTLMADSARVAATFEGSMTSLKTAVSKFSNDVLAEPIQDLADALNKIKPEELRSIIKSASIAAGSIGALVLGKKAFDIGAGIFSLFGKGGIQSAAAKASGVQPVYVTNFGDMVGMGTGVLGKAGKTTKALKASKSLSKIGRAKSFLGAGGKLLGKAAVPLMLASSAVELATADNAKQRGSAVGSLGGTLAGAKAGAVIGTMIAPGIGTAIGGVLGGFAGSALGSKLGEKVGGLFGDKTEQAQKTTQNPSEIRLVFDNAPNGLRVASNPFGINIVINRGQMEADNV